MNRVYLIRHGATAGNLQRRYIGRTDEPLCREGREQVLLLRERGLGTDYLFSSPLLRARQTAELLFPQIRPEIVENLRETDFGIFEGKTARELETCGEYRKWVDGGCLGEIPGGENVADFKERCCKAFEECMTALPPGKTAAFVIHGGGIMAILERFALPRRDFYAYHIKNGEYVECEYRETFGTYIKIKEIWHTTEKNTDIPAAPVSRDEMDTSVFNTMMERGLNEAFADNSRPAAEVFSDLRQRIR